MRVQDRRYSPLRIHYNIAAAGAVDRELGGNIRKNKIWNFENFGILKNDTTEKWILGIANFENFKFLNFEILNFEN